MTELNQLKNLIIKTINSTQDAELLDLILKLLFAEGR